MIEERLKLPEYSAKFVEVKIKRLDDSLTVLVTDQGAGFDYKKYLTFDETRAYDNHGRGIAIANSTLELEYRGNGNEVLVTIPFTH
jgi:anti-sigma regulatory factor (Ser/Thr protein kinase)